MEEIEHRTLKINSTKLHIAETGNKQNPKKILFLHGFPELWYSFRHQLTHFSSNYHAIALDLRGYGESDSPSNVESYTCFHLVGDIVGLLDLLNVDRVYLVGHDMGSLVGWDLCLFRPDRVRAFVSLSVPFRPRNRMYKPVQVLRRVFGDDYYMCRFQEEGEMEGEIAKYGAKHVIKKILTTRDPNPPMLPKGRAFDDDEDTLTTTTLLPSWFSQDDLNYYASNYELKGFTGPLNHYRNLDTNWELTAAWTGAKVKVPAVLIVGSLDMVYNMVGVKDYVHKGKFKEDVPLLGNVIVMDDVGHFINQEKPQEVNQHIEDFFAKFHLDDIITPGVN